CKKTRYVIVPTTSIIADRSGGKRVSHLPGGITKRRSGGRSAYPPSPSSASSAISAVKVPVPTCCAPEGILSGYNELAFEEDSERKRPCIKSIQPCGCRRSQATRGL